MLRLLCSLRAPYDPLDEREEELPPPPAAMDSNNPGSDGNGGDSTDLKLPRVARSPDPTSTGANTKESAIQSWKAALGIKAKSNTKHLDRSVRSQQAAGSPQEAERYIRLPERAGGGAGGGGGRPRDVASLEQTHIYLTAERRHKDLLRLPGSRSARAHLEKSSSENALQRLGVRSPAAAASPSSSSGSSGHQAKSSPREPSAGALQRLLRLEQRAPRAAAKPRASSLERNHKFRVVPSPSRARSPESVRSRLESPPPLPVCSSHHAQGQGQRSSPVPRLQLTPARHELSPGLVNLVMSKDKGGGGVQGNFINKPARGWLHADVQVADEGICYAVRYIGCLEVKESMKALNFDTRSLIAKECIARVCEAAGLKSADRRQRLDKKMARSLADKPIMDQAGSNVSLTITSSRLTLTTLEEGQVIASHEMPNISFASGGDPDTMDFVAYVAKDSRYGRVCFVLECGGVAQNVITTIGQAFELRFKEYLKRTPAYAPKSCIELPAPAPPANDDPEYYNDLPGKVPPDGPSEPAPGPPTGPAPPAPTGATAAAAGAGAGAAPRRPGGAEGGLPPLPSLPSDRDSNLIDLSSPPAASKASQHEYVNGAVIAETRQAAAAAAAAAAAGRQADPRDPFDMQPFGACLPAGAVGGAAAAPPSPTPRSQAEHKRKLAGEIWYHGPISRRTAETLLVRDGDFLVRESHGAPGQFVLTGLQNGVKKHLLLVDPEGVVRTKDRTFDSVAHLIQYHRNYQVPILSAETALTLRNPVPRR